jgi:hypothetical protein
MTLILNTCGTCTHYKRIGADPQMSCVKRPPTATLAIRHDPAPEDPGRVHVQKFTAYPSPEPSWTCGEHRSKTSH